MLSIISKVSAFAALVSVSLAVNAQTWLQNVVNENKDVIDSIVVNKDDVYAGRFSYSSYRIYFHQPLEHANPEGEQMPLRAVLLIRKGANLATTLTQCCTTGYDIDDDMWNAPSVYMGNWYYPNGMNEVAIKYKGNWLCIEHRYFGKSVPSNYWKRVEYCTGEEAAADFHALIAALKTSLKGKWVMSGVSKGGIVVAKQHTLYPDDADLFMPYSAPFCDGLNDTSMMAYWTTYSWTDELRNQVKSFQRELIQNKQAYNYFKSWGESSFPGYSADFWRADYLMNVAMMDFQAHAYWSRQGLKDSLAINQTRKQKLMQQGYSSAYLDAVMAYYCTLSSYEAWDFLSAYSKVTHRAQEVVPIKERLHRVFRPVSINKAAWDESGTAFYYQTLHEEGYFGLDFTYLYDADQQDLAAKCNREWAKGLRYTFDNPFNEDVEYDGTMRSKVFEATRTAKRPILYIYGGDDAWTGAAIPDDCIDGQLSYKYILNAQNHMASLTSTSGKLQTELWNLVEQLLNTPAGIEELAAYPQPLPQGKGAVYNLSGQQIGFPFEGGRERDFFSASSELPKGVYIVNGKKVWVK